MDQIFAGLQGNVRVSQHGAQGGVVAELHPCVIRIAGIIVRIFIKIIRDTGIRSLIDTVRMRGSDGNGRLYICDQVTAVLLRGLRANKNIETGFGSLAALKDGAKDQAGTLRDQHGGEQQRDRGHHDSHGI